eukprot:g25694.t1
MARASEESLQCMAILREQYLRWQESVELLLSEIRPEYHEVAMKLDEGDGVVSHSVPFPEKEIERQHGTATEEMPVISQAAHMAIDETMMEAFQKGPLKKVVAEILSDAAAKRVPTAELSGWALYRHTVKKMVDSKWFEWAASILILLNMVTIGIEAETSLHGHEDSFENLERELALRFIAGGRQMFCNGWFILDFVLVFVGLLALVVAPVMSEAGEGAMEGIEKLLIIRGLRLLRLVRALRMISYFKAAAWGAQGPGAQGVDGERHFANLPTSILTLCQFVTLDSIAAVYFPLMMARPLLFFFFVPLGLIISIGLMNLVTAVLVENCLENAAQEAEYERLQLKNKAKAALPAMIEIFKVLDKDHSGFISREEIEHWLPGRTPVALLGGENVFPGGLSQGAAARVARVAQWLWRLSARKCGVPSDALGFEGTDEALE